MRLVVGVQQGERAEHRGEHAAAVDVADDDHGQAGRAGQAQVDDVPGAQVDLGRAPAPSQTTTSCRSARSCRRLQHRARSRGLEVLVVQRAGLADRPAAEHHLAVASPPGLSRTGFIAASASTPAAAACMACARPISARRPAGTTAEFSDMFCALKGATRTPCRASHRQIPAVTTLFPASELVPATSSPRMPRRVMGGGGGER